MDIICDRMALLEVHHVRKGPFRDWMVINFYQLDRKLHSAQSLAGNSAPPPTRSVCERPTVPRVALLHPKMWKKRSFPHNSFGVFCQKKHRGGYNSVQQIPVIFSP